MMFELSYESLWKNDADSWKAALIPWDSETFGFNVADMQVRDLPQGILTESIRTAIQTYVKIHNISMVTTSVPGQNNQLNLLLQTLNFVHVDIAMSIQYVLSTFQSKARRILLKKAEDKEVLVAAELAGCAFQHGRYHQDYKLPPGLAHKRYKDWVMRTQKEGNPQELLIARTQDGICGFSVLERKDQKGYLHLMAVSPEWRGQGFGAEIIDLSLNYLKNQGVKTVHSKVSALNPAALNMYCAMGAKFVDCRHLLHWHAF